MSDTEDKEPSLSKLLAALAMGARAVHSLPLGDEFDFQSSFPEFSGLVGEQQERLVQVLALVEPSLTGKDATDPWVWETCADVCEALLEQAAPSPELEGLSTQVRQYSQSSYQQIVQGLVDMVKPQVTYSISVQNDRLQPFMPKVHPQKPHAVVPLDLSLVPGHGLDTRFGSLRENNALSNADLVAPTHHVAHVYEKEIESFDYCDWQLQAPTEKPPPIVVTDQLEATWIDTEQQLAELAQQLKTVDRVAVDLEAHSHRSFSGMTCLMQLSIPQQQDGSTKNFLLDTLKLWDCINQYLAEIFANPSIVKVMHGADSDVQWLQRDFGIYVVNLLDTGRAARALQLQSAGFAYLLKKYANVTTDKSFQLADWRQRPLPDAMKQYAIMDTHYLLDIVPHLLYDLHKDASIEQVLNVSRQVCLIRYDKEPFYPNGYKRILSGKATPVQTLVLKKLYDWRDATARECDESLAYICSNQALKRLSLACPTTVTALQSTLNPMPPMLLQRSHDVLGLIKECMQQDDEDDDDEKNVQDFFNPAQDNKAPPTRGILSPVLGTEEMYQQLGWTTPQVPATAVTTTTEEEDDDEDYPEGTKPRKLLVVDTANKKYRAQDYTTHSLELKGRDSTTGRGRTADGLGPARATKQEDQDQDAAQLHAAAAVRLSTREDDLLGLYSPTAELVGDEGDSEEDDFQIPKSMREIYKISNRNRRKKNTPSPPSWERGTAATGPDPPMEVDTPEGAEAVLAKSGYANIKRQREEDPSREDNINFMKEIGWIQSKEELQAAMGAAEEGLVDDAAAARETPTDGEMSLNKKTVSPFDYGSIGPIGVYNPNAPVPSNPFFAGAAVAPISSQQQQQQQQQQGNQQQKRRSTEKKRGGRGGSGRGGGRGSKQERPEKKDGRSHAYKKR